MGRKVVRKIDELKMERSCLNKAADDEPLFVLRANDELAPAIVREWATRYDRVKSRANVTGAMTSVQAAKYREANMIADMMEMWREKRDRELASLTELPISVKPEKRVDSRVSVLPEEYPWDDLKVEFEYLNREDRWMVAVFDSDGLVVKRLLSLSEWSGTAVQLISARDGTGLVRYLLEHQSLYEKIGENSGDA
jgi:hypothetical protein